MVALAASAVELDHRLNPKVQISPGESAAATAAPSGLVI